MNNTLTRALDLHDLRCAAPSIFASHAHSGVSSRYSFLPTISVVQGLIDNGWVPTSAQQQRIRTLDRQGLQKHLVRFCRQVDLNAEGDIAEIILMNSHDRSSAYTLHAGILRTYCLNGMVICDATFAKRSFTHIDFDPARVIEASVEIVRDVPRIMEGVETMKRIELTPQERLAFARAALVTRWENDSKAPVSAEQLLEVMRPQDERPTLWNTFNTVQEHIVKGGQKGAERRTESGRRMPRSRAVKGLDTSVALNKALWTLAEEMRKIKAA